METTRIVFKPAIARRLVREGYRICDLKPQKQLDGTTDYTRTTFVFAYDDGIDELIKSMTDKNNC